MLRVVTAVVLAVSVFGCAPVVGDACVGQAVCVNDNTRAALFCERGFFEDYECAGGCTKTGDEVGKDRVFCDFTGNVDNTPCPLLFAGQGRCEPAGSLIKCESDTLRYKRYQCPGGCNTAGGQVQCVP